MIKIYKYRFGIKIKFKFYTNAFESSKILICRKTANFTNQYGFLKVEREIITRKENPANSRSKIFN